LARVTVYGPAPDPVTEDTVHPVLVPVATKSAAVRPETGSEKVTLYVAADRVIEVWE
jgi:hypothetical protein